MCPRRMQTQGPPASASYMFGLLEYMIMTGRSAVLDTIHKESQEHRAMGEGRVSRRITSEICITVSHEQ